MAELAGSRGGHIDERCVGRHHDRRAHKAALARRPFRRLPSGRQRVAGRALVCGAAATDHGGWGGWGANQARVPGRAHTNGRSWLMVRYGVGAAGAVVRGVARTGERRSCRSPCPSPTACLRTWRKRYGPASRTPRPTEVQANGRNRTAYKRTTRSPADSRGQSAVPTTAGRSRIRAGRAKLRAQQSVVRADASATLRVLWYHHSAGHRGNLRRQLGSAVTKNVNELLRKQTNKQTNKTDDPMRRRRLPRKAAAVEARVRSAGAFE